MQRLEVSGAVRPLYGSLGVKRLANNVVVSVCQHIYLAGCTDELGSGVMRKTSGKSTSETTPCI